MISRLYYLRTNGFGTFFPEAVAARDPDDTPSHASWFSFTHPTLEYISDQTECPDGCPHVVLPEENTLSTKASKTSSSELHQFSVDHHKNDSHTNKYSPGQSEDEDEKPFNDLYEKSSCGNINDVGLTKNAEVETLFTDTNCHLDFPVSSPTISKAETIQQNSSSIYSCPSNSISVPSSLSSIGKPFYTTSTNDNHPLLSSDDQPVLTQQKQETDEWKNTMIDYKTALVIYKGTKFTNNESKKNTMEKNYSELQGESNIMQESNIKDFHKGENLQNEKHALNMVETKEIRVTKNLFHSDQFQNTVVDYKNLIATCKQNMMRLDTNINKNEIGLNSYDVQPNALAGSTRNKYCERTQDEKLSVDMAKTTENQIVENLFLTDELQNTVIDYKTLLASYKKSTNSHKEGELNVINYGKHDVGLRPITGSRRDKYKSETAENERSYAHMIEPTGNLFPLMPTVDDLQKTVSHYKNSVDICKENKDTCGENKEKTKKKYDEYNIENIDEENSLKSERAQDEQLSSDVIETMEKELMENLLPVVPAIDEMHEIQTQHKYFGYVMHKIKNGSMSFRGNYTVTFGLLCKINNNERCLQVIIPHGFQFEFLKCLHLVCHDMGRVEFHTFASTYFYGVSHINSDKIIDVFRYCKLCQQNRINKQDYKRIDSMELPKNENKLSSHDRNNLKLSRSRERPKDSRNRDRLKECRSRERSKDRRSRDWPKNQKSRDRSKDRKSKDRSKKPSSRERSKPCISRERSKGSRSRDLSIEHRSQERSKGSRSRDRSKGNIGKDWPEYQRSTDRSKDRRSRERSNHSLSKDWPKYHIGRDKSKEHRSRESSKDHRNISMDRSKDPGSREITRDSRIRERSKDSKCRSRERSKDRRSISMDRSKDPRSRNRSKDRRSVNMDWSKDPRSREILKDQRNREISKDHRSRERSTVHRSRDRVKDHRSRERSKDRRSRERSRDHRSRERSRDCRSRERSRSRTSRDGSKEQRNYSSERRVNSLERSTSKSKQTFIESVCMPYENCALSEINTDDIKSVDNKNDISVKKDKDSKQESSKISELESEKTEIKEIILKNKELEADSKMKEKVENKLDLEALKNKSVELSQTTETKDCQKLSNDNKPVLTCYEKDAADSWQNTFSEMGEGEQTIIETDISDDLDKKHSSLNTLNKYEQIDELKGTISVTQDNITKIDGDKSNISQNIKKGNKDDIIKEAKSLPEEIKVATRIYGKCPSWPSNDKPVSTKNHRDETVSRQNPVIFYANVLPQYDGYKCAYNEPKKKSDEKKYGHNVEPGYEVHKVIDKYHWVLKKIDTKEEVHFVTKENSCTDQIDSQTEPLTTVATERNFTKGKKEIPEKSKELDNKTNIQVVLEKPPVYYHSIDESRKKPKENEFSNENCNLNPGLKYPTLSEVNDEIIDQSQISQEKSREAKSLLQIKNFSEKLSENESPFNITKVLEHQQIVTKPLDFKSRVRNVQLRSTDLENMIKRLESGDKSVDPKYVMKGTMLCQKYLNKGNNEIRIVANEEQIEEICYIVHTMTSSHAPFEKTLAMFEKHFIPISGICKRVNKVINECEFCLLKSNP